jgi:hypothetical protein
MGVVKKELGSIATVKPIATSSAESQRAEVRIELYKRHFEISVDQVTGLSKWLTASLFAANSGGLLTILNQSQKVAYLGLSGGLFIAGLVLALLSATANQEIYNRMSDPLADMISHWHEVRITGRQNTEEHNAIAARMSKINRWLWIGPTVGWLSGLAFIAGTIVVAVGLR